MDGLVPGLPLLSGLLLAPLVPGVVNRTKAMFAGRRGPPVVQRYRDLWKLLHKGAVYSHTTSWLFRAGPVVALTTTVMALLLVPLGPVPALLSFRGDLVVVLAAFGLGRFFTMLAALDTGSSFEGMGASREAHFAALVEPVAFLALATFVRLTGELSLSPAYATLEPAHWWTVLPAIALVGLSLLGVLLVECSRIPVDDPTTHLELTMIHEVMVLDHGGPDLALVEYASALKLWVFGVLIAGLLVPLHTASPWLDAAAVIAGVLALGVAIGTIESVLARLRLLHVSGLILGSGGAATVAFLLAVLGGS